MWFRVGSSGCCREYGESSVPMDQNDEEFLEAMDNNTVRKYSFPCPRHYGIFGE
jgi:hypothetical protein